MNWTFSVGAVALLALAPDFAGQGGKAHANDGLVAKHAAANGVPEALVRRVIQIESKGNARIVSKGNYGLMQIRLGTARAMGYAGGAEGLLDPDTNMTYAVRYLAGAYRAARGNQEQAIRNYQRGYYVSAKAQGFSPYTVASAVQQPVTQQPGAPDPTLLQQDAARRQAVEQQREALLQSKEALLQSKIGQQNAIEQERIAQREALEQQRAMQRQAALQARIEQQRAAEQERIARQQAMLQEKIARQAEMEQQRVVQRQAALQQQIERDQARQQQRIEREQIRRQQAVEREQARQLQQQRREQEKQQRIEQRLPRSAQPAAPRRAQAAPSYAWYNPMRYFKHPSHQAHPYRPVQR